MRKLRNVLYVTNPLSYLSCEGESISVSVENQVVARVPLLNLEGVVCFGFMGVSPEGNLRGCLDNPDVTEWAIKT